MEKPAPATYPIHPLLAGRWSPRAFERRAVETAKLCRMMEAARWAPSSYNEQPWRFCIGTVDTAPETHALLADLLMEGNAWACQAPVLILSVAKMCFSYRGALNRHAAHDVGLAVENMVLQAQAMGLATHQMAGFHVSRAIDALALPPDYQPMAVIAVGYPGEPHLLADEKLRQREMQPRERRPLQELVFSRSWGQSFPLCWT